MAFIIDKLSNVISSTRGNDTVGQWVYCTTDSKATVLTANYFVEGFTQVRDTDTTFKPSTVPLRTIDKFNLSDTISVQIVNGSGLQIDNFNVVINLIDYDGDNPVMTVVEYDSSNDINGPSSSTDNAAVRFDSTTGTLIQNSGVIISDANAVSGLASLNINGTTTVDGIINDGTMAIASATKLATSSSIKTYVDNASGGGGGAWTFISSATASSSASISFTGLSSTYQAYMVLGTDITIGSDSNFWFRTSSNNGVSYDSGASDYAWAYTELYILASPVFSNAGALNDTKISIKTLSDAGQRSNFRLYVYNPAGTETTSVEFSGILGTGSSVDWIVSHGGGLRRSAAAVDAIQFLSATTTIVTGTFKLYGLTAS